MVITTLKNYIGGNNFAEHFVVMKTLKGPSLGLHFMRHNRVVIDTTHGLIQFPHLTMPAKNTVIETSAKLQHILIRDSTTSPRMTTKTITAFVEYPSEWHTTGTLTPKGKFTEAVSLLISPSISTIKDNKIAIGITNTTESPNLIQKNLQLADFSVATPEQTKFIKPVDTAILSMIPEADPDMTTYFSKLFKTSTPEQQNNAFIFPTTKSLENCANCRKKKTCIRKKT